MSIFNTLAEYARTQRARRRRIRTYIQISELPSAMRKDIGWPDGDGFENEVRSH